MSLRKPDPIYALVDCNNFYCSCERVFNPHQHSGGEEILVLEGVFHDEFGQYPKGSWIRTPHLSKHTPFTKEEGALIFVKTGHLK